MSFLSKLFLAAVVLAVVLSFSAFGDPIDIARELLDITDFDNAAEVLRGQLAQEPRNAEAHYLLAVSYLKWAEVADLSRRSELMDRAMIQLGTLTHLEKPGEKYLRTVLTSKEKILRRHGRQALRKNPSKGVDDVLKDQLFEEALNPLERADVLRTLSLLGSPDFETVLVRVLEGSEGLLRREAARIFSRVATDKSLETARQLMEDADVTIARECARVVARLGNADDTEALVDVALRTTGSMRLLASLPPESVLVNLSRHVESSQNPQASNKALFLIRQIGRENSEARFDSLSASVFESIMGDTDPQVAAAASEIVSRIEGREVRIQARLPTEELSRIFNLGEIQVARGDAQVTTTPILNLSNESARETVLENQDPLRKIAEKFVAGLTEEQIEEGIPSAEEKLIEGLNLALGGEFVRSVHWVGTVQSETSG